MPFHNKFPHVSGAAEVPSEALPRLFDSVVPDNSSENNLENLSFFDGMGGMGCTHEKYPQPLVRPGALVDWLAIACQFVKAFVLLKVLAVAMPHSERIKSLSISLRSKHRWHLTSFPFSIGQVSIEVNI